MSTTPSDNPLGDIDGTQMPQGADSAKSIVDTMFNLDEFLSGDVRRAELNATFSIEPYLQADIEERRAEYDRLTDSQGRPLEDSEQTLGGSERSASVVMSELKGLEQRYTKSLRSVRVRAMDEDDWTAFLERHKKATDEGDYPPEFWEDLISQSAISPKFSVEDVRKFRAGVSHAVYSLVGNTAFRANTMSGVSIPKSLFS